MCFLTLSENFDPQKLPAIQYTSSSYGYSIPISLFLSAMQILYSCAYPLSFHSLQKSMNAPMVHIIVNKSVQTLLARSPVPVAVGLYCNLMDIPVNVEGN